MYGNKVIPGIQVGKTYRNQGSIWVGYIESTWFDYIFVEGSGENKLPLGTILKQDISGKYVPIDENDIITSVGNLPGKRLAIVADETASAGATEITGEGDDAVIETVESVVLVGKQGHVDKAKLLVGETAFNDLDDTQQMNLRTQLEAWHFQLVDVLEA